MITTFILQVVFVLFGLLFGWLAIPAMPVVITAGFGYALDFMALPLSIAKAYVGHEFFLAMLTAIVVLMNIERVWHTIQWLWHKIRG